MTKKLYYEDSHQDSCHATVLSCTWNEKKQCYEVVLNQTVFFPEGGGQYADTGVLGGMKVLDVQEKGDLIIHYTDGELQPDTEVDGVSPKCNSTPASISFPASCTAPSDMIMSASIWARNW